MADAGVVRDREGPTDWPEEWGTETPPLIARVVIVAFGFGFVVALLAALSGEWAVGATMTVVSALLVVLGFLMLRKREPNFSEQIRIVDLDPKTGAVQDPATGGPSADSLRGVVLPYHRRTDLIGLVMGLLMLALSPLVWLRIHDIRDTTLLTVIGIVAAVAVAAYGLSLVVQFLSIGSTQPKVVLTADGLWYNTAAKGVFAPWSEITAVGSVGREGRSGPPVVSITVSDAVAQIPMQPIHFLSNVVKDGRIAIPATATVLDGAVLLKFVQLLWADRAGELRAMCAERNGVVSEIEQVYARWNSGRSG